MKATHKGTCQICGSVQKLPGGLLSLHGYTVAWGFFSGTCYGAGNLPFEQSKGMIDKAIADAVERRNRVAALSAEYKAGKQLEGNKAWYHVYHSASGYGRDRTRGGYRWEHVEVITKPFLQYVAKDAKPERMHAGIPWEIERDDIDAVRAYLNRCYAEQLLDSAGEELDRYVAWQQKRIANWKELPLIPLSFK